MCIYSETCDMPAFCLHTCIAELHARLADVNDGHCQ